MMWRKYAAVYLATTVACWGFLAWSYLGTDVVAHRHQESARTSIQKAIGDANTEPAATDDVAAVKVSKNRTVVGVGLLTIPAAKVKDAPIVEGFDTTIFNRGLVGTSGSRPGAVGNFVVGAHVITHGSQFADLGDLEAGDRVTVRTSEGTFVYRIRAAGMDVSAKVNWPLMPIPSSPIVPGGVPDLKPVITLITCASRFHTDTRLVVIGDLVNKEPK
jgi:sortase A